MHDSSLCWSVGTCITVGAAPTGTEGDLDSPLGNDMGRFHWSVPMGTDQWGLKSHNINGTNMAFPMEASFSCYSVQQLKDSVDNIPICSMMDEKLP